MTFPSTTLPATTSENRLRQLAHQYGELGKARLNGMVLVTTAVGFVLGSVGAIQWMNFLLTLVGTGLAALGAAAFNQVLEVDRDAAMERTWRRPLPAGAMSKGHGILFAFLTSVAGVAILNEFVNPLTAALAAINILVYVLIYTPLKSRTSLNTLVGAVCGALPPMMGWAAASESLPLGAWLLGAILFIWQIPHFLALAWLYRADYAKGGFRMLPVIDPSGRLTCLLIVLYTITLVPLGLAMTVAGVAGWVFAAGSVVLGAGWLWLGLKLMRNKTLGNAKRVFLGSVIYLPLLLILMVADGKTPQARHNGVEPVRFRAPVTPPAVRVSGVNVVAEEGGIR